MALPDVPGGELVFQQTVPYPTWWSSATTVYVRGTADFPGPSNYAFPRDQVYLYPYGVEVPANVAAESSAQIIPWSQIVYIEQAS